MYLFQFQKVYDIIGYTEMRLYFHSTNSIPSEML